VKENEKEKKSRPEDGGWRGFEKKDEKPKEPAKV